MFGFMDVNNNKRRRAMRLFRWKLLYVVENFKLFYLRENESSAHVLLSFQGLLGGVKIWHQVLPHNLTEFIFF